MAISGNNGDSAGEVAANDGEPIDGVIGGSRGWKLSREWNGEWESRDAKGEFESRGAWKSPRLKESLLSPG